MDLKVVDSEEARPIYAQPDPECPGRTLSLSPGRTRYSLILEMPDGYRMKVQVTSKAYEKYVGSLPKATDLVDYEQDPVYYT